MTQEDTIQLFLKIGLPLLAAPILGVMAWWFKDWVNHRRDIRHLRQALWTEITWHWTIINGIEKECSSWDPLRTEDQLARTSIKSMWEQQAHCGAWDWAKQRPDLVSELHEVPWIYTFYGRFGFFNTTEHWQDTKKILKALTSIRNEFLKQLQEMHTKHEIPYKALNADLRKELQRIVEEETIKA